MDEFGRGKQRGHRPVNTDVCKEGREAEENILLASSVFSVPTGTWQKHSLCCEKAARQLQSASVLRNFSSEASRTRQKSPCGVQLAGHDRGRSWVSEDEATLFPGQKEHQRREGRQKHDVLRCGVVEAPNEASVERGHDHDRIRRRAERQRGPIVRRCIDRSCFDRASNAAFG
ncbi:uncharacterized protein MAM_04406 [Metarhizium album ARSEF 1941]|uniref:Uncharacterized protein n=1 Tax=Metarhizium album (strain ARSEF 1941) TaxID=1081103 RepID=A0A0B2WX58_METAS|nr:uncharacterized protein MAM_04406 [Metarhizium album ARSEF 1941]KHN98017.1 hypothetical protein MAM_04406 [Metarhizium album ARSEF 1941]